MAFNSRMLNDGETVVIDTRTHPKVLLVPLVVLLLTLALGAWLLSRVGEAANGWLRWIILAVLLLVAAWFCLRPLLTWLTTSFTVTDQRIVTRSGVFTRRGHDIPLGRVATVNYEQSLLDRMLGCGTLFVSDASDNGPLVLRDIPRAASQHRRVVGLLHPRDSQTRGGDAHGH